jgi:hypothetical protein
MAFPDLSHLLRPAMGKIWRVVETQEKAAARDITSNRDEQERLEELLELHKPPAPPGTEKLSYLLATPFRYPPLEHGSRFGTETEPGIFYGALELHTAFAETAAYLWLFQAGSRAGQVLDTIRDERMSFSARVSSLSALDLREAVFRDLRRDLASPSDWSQSQDFGTRARKASAEAIWYPSARCEQGTNVALLSPKAMASRKEAGRRHWKLRLTRESCWFGELSGEAFEFERGGFEREGYLRHPAL